MRVTRTLLAAAIPLALSTVTAYAQQGPTTSQVSVGSYMAYHFDTRDPALGAQLDVPVASRLALYPSGAVYLVDSGSLVGLNADLKYRLPMRTYVGGGLNLMHREIGDADNTDAGVNLLGGIEGRTGRIHPFAEGRVILNDGSAFQLAAGLNIALR
jgi:hypothetical protein